MGRVGRLAVIAVWPLVWLMPPVATAEERPLSAPAPPVGQQAQAERPRLAELARQAEKLHDEGKFAEAAQALKQKLALARQLLGDDHDQTLSTTTDLVEAYVAADDFPPALQLARQVLELKARRFGEAHWQTVTARVELAELDDRSARPEDQRKRLREADRLVERAVKLYERAEPGDDSLDDASDALSGALELRLKVLGSKHRAYGEAIFWLGMVDASRDLPKYAEESFREALAIFRSAYGEGHPECASTLYYLGEACRQQRKWPEAVEAARQSREILKTAVGTDDAQYDPALWSLVRILEPAYLASGDGGYLAEAKAAARDLLALRTKRRDLPPWKLTDARLAVKRLERLGQLDPSQRERLRKAEQQIARLDQEYLDPDEWEQLHRQYRDVLETYRTVLGEESEGYVVALQKVAGVYHGDWSYGDAARLYRQAADLARKVYGEEHPRYAWSLYYLARTWADHVGDEQEALDALHQAMAAWKRVWGTEDQPYRKMLQWIVDPLDRLARDHEQQGEYAPARDCRRELLEAKTALLGAGHVEVVDARWSLRDAERRLQLDEAQRRRLDAAWEQMFDAGQLAENGDLAGAKPLVEQALGTRKELLGEEHPGYAECLAVRANLASLAGDHERGEADLLRAEAIFRAALGPEHPRTINCQTFLSLLRARRGNLAQALQSQREAVARLEKAGRVGYAGLYQFALFTLAQLLEQAIAAADERDDFLTSRQHYLELAAVETKRHFAEDWRVVDARRAAEYCSVLAALAPDDRRRVFHACDQFDEAVKLLNEGKPREAAALLGEASAVIGRLLGEESESYAAVLGAMAQASRQLGDFRQAEQQVVRAGEILRKALGDEHPDYAAAENALAGIYLEKGDYARADALLKAVDDVYARTLDFEQYDPAFGGWNFSMGKDQPNRARVLLRRARLQMAMGDDVQARELLREARQVLEASLGKDDVSVADSLTMLALLEKRTGGAARAEPLLARAAEIYKKAEGEQSDTYAVALVRLGHVRRMLGQQEAARPLFTQACDILRKALAEARSETDAAIDCGWLADVARALGEPREAAEHLRKRLEILERMGLADSPAYAGDLVELARLCVLLGDDASARPLLESALARARKQLDWTAAIQSERQQMAMLAMYRGVLDSYVSLAARGKAPLGEAYAHVLRWKGSVFARQRLLRLLRGKPELAGLFARLQKAASELSAVNWSAVDDSPSWRQWEMYVRTENKERLEKELAQHGAAMWAAQPQGAAAPGQVLSALPNDAALVDFLQFACETAPGASGAELKVESHLAAFLVAPGQAMALVDLGPVKPIAEAVDRWRESFGAGSAGVAAGAELRRRVWEPIAPRLAAARTVLVSPDGPLCRFPLAALPGNKPGTYLIEDCAVAVVPVPQLIPELLGGEGAPAGKEGAGGEGSLLLVGAVDFDADPSRPGATAAAEPAPGFVAQADTGGQAARGTQQAARGTQQAARGTQQAARGTQPTVSRPPRREGLLHFDPLPGFQGELDAVRAVYVKTHPKPQTLVLRGPAATEDALRCQVPGSRAVHLITHGFFAPGAIRSALGASDGRSRGMDFSQDDEASPGENASEGFHPGLLSGLALAGANRGPLPGEVTGRLGDDGILTALEVAELDLARTDLVVLSACETGLGEAAGGEGLLGLQRAFQVAGARTVVASLWKVSDDATRRLMADFYRNLWHEHKPPLEALRQAQLGLLREGTAATDEPGRGAPGRITRIEPSRGPGRAPPRLWAAWVLSGDPGY